jgi:hypothetical protein
MNKNILITGVAGFIGLIIFNIGFFVYDNYISKEKIYLSKLETYI